MLTLESAIIHAEEVAEEQEKLWRICPASENELFFCDGSKDCTTLANGKDKGCLKCAAEHRQLAEWLKDYKRLLEQEKWIPVSERLPELNENAGTEVWKQKVLITGYLSFDSKKGLFVSEAFIRDVINNTVYGTVVKAWMPLPEPYEPQESEG